LAAALSGLALGLLRGVAVQPAAAGAAARPSIIMIMADDVDHRNLGA